MVAYLAGRCAKPSPAATPKPTISPSLRLVDENHVLDIGPLGKSDHDLADDSSGIKLPSIPDFPDTERQRPRAPSTVELSTVGPIPGSSLWCVSGTHQIRTNAL